jgi:hypothetical protein
MAKGNRIAFIPLSMSSALARLLGRMLVARRWRLPPAEITKMDMKVDNGEGHCVPHPRGCRARSFRPHGNVVDEGPFAPLGDCLVVQPILCRKLFERSLRSLYRSSDGVRGRGAAMKYLVHSASRNAGSVCLIPSHSGTKHLGFKTPFQAILKELGKDVQIRFA